MIKTSKGKSWTAGYIAGKKRARFEILIAVAILYFGIALIGRWSS